MVEKYQADGEYHFINKEYPGLEWIHKEPNIFIVHDFLTNDECDNVINLMKDKKMVNAYISGGNQDLDYRKCLTKTIFKSSPEFNHFKRFRKKVSCLIDVNENQLEVTNLTRYLGNENFFKKHKDAYEYGYGFERGFTTKEVFNRVVTVIVYLNDVHSGGETRFNDIDIDIKPKKGMALIFFPGLIPTSKKPGHPADNTTHEALPPIGEEKWILQQWVWSGPYLKG